MSLSIDTVIQVAGYIKTAVDIYNEIQAVPGEVAELKTQLEELGKPLSSLASVMAEANSDTSTPASQKPLAAMDKNDRGALATTVAAALADCKEVKKLFAAVKKRHITFLGGYDIQARTDWLARAWYRYGVGADQVKALMHRIRERRDAIQLFLDVLGLKSRDQIQRKIAAMKKDQAKILKLLETQATQEDAQRKALEDKVKVLEAELAKERAEAKKAKARECLDRAATVMPRKGDQKNQDNKGYGGAADKKVERKEKEKNDEPPGPGKLSKTPSMGPKVIRGKPTPPKPMAAKAEAGQGQKGPSKSTPAKEIEKPAQDPQPKPKSEKKLIGRPEVPIVIQVEKMPSPGNSSGSQHVRITQVDKPSSPNGPEKKQKATGPSPSPSPRPRRSEYSILFVDPTNIGRSALCHAILAVLDRWIRDEAGARSPIAHVDSAGFFIRNGSNCMEEVEGLEYATPQRFGKGGYLMPHLAYDRLFKAELAGPGRWAELERSFRTRLSVGMRREHFQTFDYIVCFTQREHENLLRLRAAIVAKDGKEALPKGKGKILHLGRFLTSDDKAPEEITAINDTKNAEAWASKTRQLTTALSAFLKQELKWEHQANGKSHTPLDGPGWKQS